jgi:hypothetical protein
MLECLEGNTALRASQEMVVLPFNIVEPKGLRSSTYSRIRVIPIGVIPLGHGMENNWGTDASKRTYHHLCCSEMATNPSLRRGVLVGYRQ